jgi:hypothetical protein
VCGVCVRVTGGPPCHVSGDGGISVMAMGPRDSERGRGRDGRELTVTAMSFRAWSRMIETEKREKGRRRRTEVSAMMPEQGREARARRSLSRRRRRPSVVMGDGCTVLAGSHRSRWRGCRRQRVPAVAVAARRRERGGAAQRTRPYEPQPLQPIACT